MMLMWLIVGCVFGSIHSQQQVFSYYNSRGPGGIQSWEIPGDKITHVIWSFANIWRDGTITFVGKPPLHTENLQRATRQIFENYDTTCNCKGDCLKGEIWQMFLLKRKYPHLKVILSIGGWTWSNNFSDVFAFNQSRSRAIETSFDLLEHYGFDGIDIDWEFPVDQRDDYDAQYWSTRPEDNDNLVLFFKEIKSYWALKRRKYLLTTALRAVAAHGSKSTWTEMGKVLDYGLMMAYEYHHNDIHTRPGSALRYAPHDSPDDKVNTVVGGVQTYLDLGFPRSKLVVGVPLYSVGWKGLSPNYRFTDNIPGLGHPLGKSLQMVPPIAYDNMIQMVSNNPAWTHTFDQVRGISVFYNHSHVYFMDSVQTMTTKAKWIADNNFAGLMIWNSAQDMPEDSEYSLTVAISKSFPVQLDQDSPKFCLDDAIYCNMRCVYLSTNPNLGRPRSFNSALFNRPLYSGVLAILAMYLMIFD